MKNTLLICNQIGVTGFLKCIEHHDLKKDDIQPGDFVLDTSINAVVWSI